MSFFNTGKYATVRLNIEPHCRRMEVPAGTWIKCKECGRTLYADQLEQNLNVCPHCGNHLAMTANKRIELITDPDSFEEMDAGMHSTDPLEFVDSQPYPKRLSSSEKKTGMNEAVVCGKAALNGRKYMLGVMDFRFMGASMGSVVGEKITRMLERAADEKYPAVIVSASGGARMQEGILSLMQMAKTCAAVERLHAARQSFIVIMTHPTYGGVTASFASLGDVIFAEPKAMIGFAGPRVIQETTNSKLPEGFQTAEFLLEKGMIDRVIERKNLRRELSLCLEYLS